MSKTKSTLRFETPSAIGCLDLCSLGLSSWLEIPLYEDFAARGVPVSVRFPFYGTPGNPARGFISFCPYLQAEDFDTHFRLYMPGGYELCFVYSSADCCYRCQQTGEIIYPLDLGETTARYVYEEATGMAFEFPFGGGYPQALRFPDRSVANILVSSTYATMTMPGWRSGDLFVARFELDAYGRLSLGEVYREEQGSKRPISSLSFSYGSSVTATLKKYSSNTSYVEDGFSLTTNGSGAYVQLQCTHNGRMPAETITLSAASGQVSLALQVSGSWSETWVLDASNPSSLVLSGPDGYLETYSMFENSASYSCVPPRKLLVASFRDGRCEAMTHDYQMRPKFRLGPAPIGKSSCENRCLNQNPFFDGGASNWLLTNATYSQTGPSGLSSLSPCGFGGGWVYAQSGSVSCSPTPPQCGDVCTWVVGIVPVGTPSGTFTLSYSSSPSLGAAESFSRTFDMSSMSLGLNVVFLSFFIASTPSSCSAAISFSGAAAYIKFAQLIPGLDSSSFSYVINDKVTLKRGSTIAQGYVRDVYDRVEYAVGNGGSPKTTFLGTTSLPSNQVDDIGRNSASTYQGDASSLNYRIASSSRGDTSSILSASASYSDDGWYLSSLTKEGLTQTHSIDRWGRVKASTSGLYTLRTEYDADGREVGFSVQKAAQSYTIYANSITYGTNGEPSSIVGPGSETWEYGYDSYGRCEEEDYRYSALRERTYGTDSIPTQESIGGDTISLAHVGQDVTAASCTDFPFSYTYSYSLPGELNGVSDGSDGWSLERSVSPNGTSSVSFRYGNSTPYLSFVGRVGCLSRNGLINGSFPDFGLNYGGSLYRGDVKTFATAMEGEGYCSLHPFEAGQYATFFQNGSTAGTLDATSVRGADKLVRFAFASASTCSLSSSLFATTGMPTGVVNFFYSGSGSASIVRLGQGQITVSVSVSSGSVVVSATGPTTQGYTATSSLTLGPASTGWNSVAFGFSSPSLLLASLRGCSQQLATSFVQPSITAIAAHAYSGATIGAFSAGRRFVTADFIRSASLVAEDCVGLADFQGTYAHQNAYFHMPSSASDAVSLFPLSGTLLGTDRPKFFAPNQGIRVLSDDGGSSPLCRPSDFFASPSDGRLSYRACGQRLAYSINAAGGIATRFFFEPLGQWSSPQRRILTLSGGNRAIAFTLAGTTLTVSVGSSTACTATVGTGLNEVRAAFVYAQLTPGTVSVMVDVWVNGTTYYNTLSFRTFTAPNIAWIGSDASGNLPFNGLIRGVAFVSGPYSIPGLQTLLQERGIEVISECDGLGRVATRQMRYDGSASVSSSYSYCADGQSTTSRLSSETTSVGGSTLLTQSYVYDSSGRFSSIGGQTVAYDNKGFISAGFGETVSYDASGNIVSITASGVTKSFSYGSGQWADRLASVGVSGSWSLTFSYGGADATRPSQIVETGSGARTLSLTYVAGRLKTAYASGQTYNYKYDGNGFLRKISGPSGDELTTFSSDGRLLFVKLPSGDEVSYSYEGSVPVAMTWRSSSFTRRYVVVCDALGRIHSIVNPASLQRADYSYGLWGLLSVNDGTSEGVSSVNRLVFKGYYYDSFLRVYRLGPRCYDPRAGRFWEPDSPDYACPSRVGGLNPYAYCYNDPVAYVDPAGHLGVLGSALVGLLLGIFISGGLEIGKQLFANRGDWASLDWGAIGRQAIIGGTLGFAGWAGGAALGGFLLGATTITGVQVGIWFGLSGLVSFAGGIGAYAVETFSHGSDWDGFEAIGSGFMGLAAGIMAYGAGGISKLVLTSSRIAGFVVRPGVKFVFTFPLQFTEGSLIDYLS